MTFLPLSLYFDTSGPAVGASVNGLKLESGAQGLSASTCMALGGREPGPHGALAGER